jgi:hypothetical protein
MTLCAQFSVWITAEVSHLSNAVIHNYRKTENYVSYENNGCNLSLEQNKIKETIIQLDV